MNNDMHFFVYLAKNTSERDLVRMLCEACMEWSKRPSPETHATMRMYSYLILIKDVAKNMTAEAFAKEFEMVRNIRERFKATN